MTRINIPKLHYISQGSSPQENLDNIESACASGAELVQLRLKKQPTSEVLKAAKEARDITTHYQTKLIINDYYQIAKEVKADGVHLGKNDSSPVEARTALASWQIIGGTANSIDDCQKLIDLDIDYIGLGPYRFTVTKENLSPVIGYDGCLNILHKLSTQTPIIAIGGITLEDVPKLLERGIFGIAASSEITKDFSKISLFNELLNIKNALDNR